MEAYKDARYSGFRGKLRWVKDKFKGLPEEANQIFVTARAGYVNRMQGVISHVADTIATTLASAKVRIARGQAELQAEVKKMQADLQAAGRKAAGEFAGKFDELTESVNAKSQELVQTLASKYSEAMKSVDAEIDAEKEANKGLIDKAVDAVKGVVKTILALKDLLLNVLAKAASAIAAIISDPIGFLGNLVDAVGSGLRAFVANIGTHLKNGLVGWLLGAVASTGLELPAKFDLKGIIGMIASLLGLTWNAIRGRIVSRGVPEQAITAVEESAPIAQKLRSEGVAGIWELIVERVGDLKDKLLSKISDFLIPTVLIAGITWLISLLNPASAFIKAVKMIIDIVTFIVERGAQIAAFVNSVLDAVIAIAGGGGGGVPGLIEKALAGSIPVLIGALAAFLGIGGIADKVKAFFQSLTKPVMKAVDWVADTLVKFGKSVWGKLKAGAKKLKDKVTGKNKDTGKDKDGKEKSPGPIAVGRPMSFEADQHSHRLWYDTSGSSPQLMVASTPTPVREHLPSLRSNLASATPEKQAEGNGLLAQIDTILATTDPRAEELSKAEATRKTGTAVDNSAVQAAEKVVVAGEQSMVPVLTRLFELAGVGEGDEMVDLPMPNGAVARCVKRGTALVPIGRVSIYPTGLIARPHLEELDDINRQLQGERSSRSAERSSTGARFTTTSAHRRCGPTSSAPGWAIRWRASKRC
jgi:Skp family chaperone for outer membrane proteins